MVFIVLIIIAMISITGAGCPGRAEAKGKIKFSFTPEIDGLELEIGPRCAPNSPYGFGIRNYENDDVLIYIDGAGVEHEIFPHHGTSKTQYENSSEPCNFYCTHELKCEAANGTIFKEESCSDNQVCCILKDMSLEERNYWYNASFFRDENIPQEIGSEWTRTLYFKNSPDEKIILSAKIEKMEKSDYQNLSILVILLLAIIAIGIIFTIIRRKIKK